MQFQAERRTRPLASETESFTDEQVPESVNIDALQIDGYDDAASRDVFAKARAFTLPKTAKAFGFYPFYKPLDNNEGPEAIVDGKRVIMLGSNNYLGLTRHPRVMQAAMDAIAQYGTSLTGSRLLNGTTHIHENLERLLAQFFGKEACLTFTTGYQANLGVISALVNKRAIAVIDRSDHGSIYDGCSLADGETVRFRHNDLDHLDQILARVTKEKAALVAIDGVYSMGGDLAKLPQIVEICRRYGARLLVDDAHGVGTIGKGGRGTASHFGLDNEVDLIVGTFSKSLASIGGFVCGDADVIEWIRHFARPSVFSASPPPASVMAATTALQVLMEQPEIVDKLQANAQMLRDGLRDAGFDIGDTETPIVPITVGDERKTVSLWKDLLAHGVYTNAVIFPAVPRNGAILRTSCMATHNAEQIEQAVGLLTELGRKHKLIA